MYNTKLSGGSADREQLLRIQRELNEKYENEQPQASAACAAFRPKHSDIAVGTIRDRA